MKKSLAEFRKDKYMSVNEFAEFLDVAPDTIYRIQRGERPRLSTMRKIAERLGVRPASIFEFSRERERTTIFVVLKSYPMAPGKRDRVRAFFSQREAEEAIEHFRRGNAEAIYEIEQEEVGPLVIEQMRTAAEKRDRNESSSFSELHQNLVERLEDVDGDTEE